MQSRYFDNIEVGTALKTAALAVASITEISGTLSKAAGSDYTTAEIDAIVDRVNELTAAINLIAGTAAT